MNSNHLAVALRVPLLCFVCLFAALSLPGAVLIPQGNSQDTLFLVVNQSGDLEKSGYSLRNAVAAANQHVGVTEIRIAPGLFRKKEKLVLCKVPLRVEPYTRLIIRGPGSEYLTLSGNHQNQLFDVASEAYLELRDLTLAEGRTAGDHYGLAGGAIHSKGTLVMKRCLVTNNIAAGWLGRGGGICNVGGVVVLEGCRLLGNTVIGGSQTSAGGGLYSKDGVVVIRNGTITGNRATGGTSNQGAGIYCAGGVLEISNTHISENVLTAGRDTHYGGGLYLESKEARLTDCSVAGNVIEGSAENYGAGIYNRGSLHLAHCELKENRTGKGQRNRGGGIYHSTGSLTLIQCSLNRNKASGGGLENLGGGIYSFADQVNIGHTAMYGNRAASLFSDMDGKLNSLGNNQISSMADIILMPKKTGIQIMVIR